MKKRLLLAAVVVALLLLPSCLTQSPVEPAVVQKVVVPSLGAMKPDVFALFPLIDEPQTDSDLMYNSLVLEMAWTMSENYADMMEAYCAELRAILAE